MIPSKFLFIPQVNFNGVLSFGNTGVVSQNPVAFPSSSAGPIMAPFWTQSQFSGSTGHVYYRADSTSRTLTNLQDEIAGVFRGTGITQPSLVLSQAIIVTWIDLQDQSDSQVGSHVAADGSTPLKVVAHWLVLLTVYRNAIFPCSFFILGLVQHSFLE